MRKMSVNHLNRGHREYDKARVTLLCCFIVFVGIELFIFLWASSKLGSRSIEVDESSNTSNEVTEYPEYDDTAEWNESVNIVSDVLFVDTTIADDILHQIADVYNQEFGKTLYFFSEFELMKDTKNHYSITSGDDYARFEIKIENNHVDYVQQLQFPE